MYAPAILYLYIYYTYTYLPIQDSWSIFNFMDDDGSLSCTRSVEENINEPPIIIWGKHIVMVQNIYINIINYIKLK